MAHDLSIPEELLLLALDDESGAGRSDLALGGGLLAELAFLGAIEIEHDGKKAMVVVSDGAVVEQPLFAECLADVSNSEKLRDATHWVQKFSTKKGLKGRIAEPLVERGILDERKRKLLFFELTKYPESNPVPEAAMTERIRVAIEHDHVVPDGRTAALITIGNAAGLLSKNLDKKMLRQRRDRLKELAEGDTVAGAVKSAVDAVSAAIIIGVTAGAAAS